MLRLILTRARSRERTNRATEVPPPPSPKAPLLRAVEPRDMAAIAAMVAALAAEHGETASAIPDALGRDLFAKDVRHWLAAFVAESHPSDDVAPLGYALVLRSYDAMHARRKAVLLHLYVVPEARRRGVGAALLSAARDQARVWRCAFLEVGVTADNLVAQQFYQARGMAAWPFHGGIRYCVTT